MSLRGGFSTHYNTFEPVMPMLKAKSDRTQKGSSDISYLRARPKYRSKSWYCHHWCRHDWCRYHWCRTFDVNFLMPVTIDARHDWCPWSFFDASHFWCPSLLMPRKLFWGQSQSRLMSVTIDARHYWCPSLLMPVPSNAGLNHNPEFY